MNWFMFAIATAPLWILALSVVGVIVAAKAGWL